MSRDRTSRPNASVPSQWAADGAASMAPKSTASGSYGASGPEATATMNITRMMAPPTAPSGRCRQNSRIVASHPGDAAGASIASSGRATAISGTGCVDRATRT